MKKIIFIFIIINIVSCLPNREIIPAKIISELKIDKDIYVYKNEIVNLDNTKIYNVDNEYYFGNFFYIKNDTVYALDVSNERIVVADGDNITSFPLEYENLEKSKISLIDTSNNIYIVGYELRYIGDVTITNVIMSLPSETPIFEGNDIPEIETYTVAVTNTNYTRVGFVSLNKLSPEGKTLYSINRIVDNEYENLIKIVEFTNSKFAVLKRNKNQMPVIDIYNSESGIKEKEYILNDIESTDSKSLSYKRIVDVNYIKDKNKIALLVMNVINGKHHGDSLYTSDIEDIKMKEEYKIPSRDNSLAIGISSTGRIIYTGMDNGLYFFIRTNPFISPNYSKEYIDLDNVNKLRSISMFDDGIYGFSIENGYIKFQHY